LEAKDIITTLVGFVLGVFGSWLFWRFLLVLRPDVRISPHVLKGHDRLDSGKVVYRLKVYNFGRRQVVDLQAQARLVEKSEDRWPVLKEVKLRFDGGVTALGRKKDFGDPLAHIPPGFILLILDESKLDEFFGG
jgi:hypothetical protein